jgi:hypothetical protein
MAAASWARPVSIDGYVEHGGKRFARYRDPDTCEPKFWPVDQFEKRGRL